MARTFVEIATGGCRDLGAVIADLVAEAAPNANMLGERASAALLPLH